VTVPIGSAACIIPQPYEEIGLSTKQIHDINDFRRLVLVYKQDFLYATTITEKVLLGYAKYNNYSGAEFKSLPIEEQENYSLVDSKLVMDLSKYNNFEVLDAMFSVAEITGLDLEKVCRTNLSTWWGAIFDKLIREGKCPPLIKREFEGTYKRADVLSPKKALYNNTVVVDAKSLYPSVGIKYNLSFETINCDCCANNPDAKLNKLIPDKFTKDCVFVNASTDWICRQRVGAFPDRLIIFKTE
jgi:DNA polymerase elongation subunit (family B)